LVAGDDADDLEKLAIRLQAEKFKVLPVKNENCGEADGIVIHGGTI